jgi:hypothetical protein
LWIRSLAASTSSTYCRKAVSVASSREITGKFGPSCAMSRGAAGQKRNEEKNINHKEPMVLGHKGTRRGREEEEGASALLTQG